MTNEEQVRQVMEDVMLIDGGCDICVEKAAHCIARLLPEHTAVINSCLTANGFKPVSDAEPPA